MSFARLSLACLALCAILFRPAPALAAETGITVFAAASTTNGLTELAGLYKKAGKGAVVLAFASSSTLAKQIENGAPADVFLSANQEWMDYLEKKELLLSGSRKDLLGNTLVLIAPASSAIGTLTVDKSLDLPALLGADGRLAVGDPAHVPVGMYAREALTSLGLWAGVENRLAPSKDVRSGMALVERGEAPLGIVYGSDAGVSGKVKVVGVFPADSHKRVDYPVGLLKTPHAEAAGAFVEFLSGPEARAVWKKYGFETR